MIEKNWISYNGELVVREQLDILSIGNRELLRDPKKFKGAVWEKDRGICGCCNKQADPINWHADHKKAYASGGKTELSNLQVTHPECNWEKKGKSDRKFGDSDHLGEQVTETVIETLVSLLVRDLIYPKTKKIRPKKLLKAVF